MDRVLFSKFHYVYALLFLFHFVIGFGMALYLCYARSYIINQELLSVLILMNLIKNKRVDSMFSIRVCICNGIKGNCEI